MQRIKWADAQILTDNKMSDPVTNKKKRVIRTAMKFLKNKNFRIIDLNASMVVQLQL